jgi:hypothetical protein
MERGIPRYLIGKATSWQGNKPVANSTYSSEHQIRARWHLLGLQPCSKMARMVHAIWMSSRSGAMWRHEPH